MCAAWAWRAQGKCLCAAPGLDCVVVCALGAAACLSRAAGARVDPVTGQAYNFTSNSPPTNKLGLALRLQARGRLNSHFHMAAVHQENPSSAAPDFGFMCRSPRTLKLT